MKNKLMKYFSLLGLLLIVSLGQVTTMAADVKEGQLLYDLKYDKEKSVLSGKSQPNANIYINDLAGSIVADENGDFEMPVPKDLKVSTVLMLDAEGDASTDVRFNFEKNTVETKETSTTQSSKETSNGNSSSSATSNSKESEVKSSEEKEKKTSETKSSKEKDTSESVTSTEETTSSKEATVVTTDSYNVEDEEEPTRSLIWLWTLLSILGVAALAIGAYFWYKKKLEKEEKARKRSKKHSKKKEKKELNDDLEDDLYAMLADDESKPKKSRKTKNKDISEASINDLDEMIEAELKKEDQAPKARKRKKSTSGKSRSKQSSGKKMKKKKTDK